MLNTEFDRIGLKLDLEKIQIVDSMTIFKMKTNLPTIINVIIASLAKAALLFSVALVLFKLNIIPSIFLTAMGVVQAGTAVAGGLIALAITKLGILDNNKTSNNE